MNVTLKQDAQLLDPASLTRKTHKKGTVFSVYATEETLHDSDMALLVLTEIPHTRALVSVTSLDKHFAK